MVLLGLGLIGCLGRHKGPIAEAPEARAPVVVDISIEGNGRGWQGTSDYLVRAAMEQGDSARFWWVAPRQRAVRLDQAVLTEDAWRIETWYAHHGYFDARFLGWEVVSLRGHDERVRLVGHVDEGEPTVVKSVTWVVVDGQGAPDPNQTFARVVGRPLANLLKRQAAIQEDDRFSLSAYQETKDQTELRLRDQSFAYARVSGEVRVDGDAHTAEVRYLCHTGPPSRFGAVRLEGETTVPQDVIRDEIQLEAGDAFSATALGRTQRDLFALGTFSVVNVVPELDPLGGPNGGPNPIVPVRVELTESRWRQLRVGGGVAVQNGKQDLRASTELQHVNLLNRLWRLQTAVQGGYTWLARWDDVLSSEESAASTGALSGGPSAKISADLTIPRFPTPKWRLEHHAAFELGVEENYQYATPTFSTALSWRPGHRWVLGFSGNLQYYLYFNEPAGFSGLSTSGSALDTANPFFLTYLQETALYDSRDDVLNTTRGTYLSLAVSEAGPPGQFSYLRIESDNRKYLRLGKALHELFNVRPKLYMAGRLAGGFIQPFAQDGEVAGAVPYAQRLYLGGSNSVRGWIDQHLGSYQWRCNGSGAGWQFSALQTTIPEDGAPWPEGGVDACELEIVPEGGLLSAYGSLELRYFLPGALEDFGLVGFTDIGMTWTDPEDLSIPLQPSFGLGLRYATPVGPLRVDVARRVGDLPMFAQEPRYQLYISLSEAF